MSVAYPQKTQRILITDGHGWTQIFHLTLNPQRSTLNLLKKRHAGINSDKLRFREHATKSVSRVD
jgi:hypothetical protein